MFELHLLSELFEVVDGGRGRDGDDVSGVIKSLLLPGQIAGVQVEEQVARGGAIFSEEGTSEERESRLLETVNSFELVISGRLPVVLLEIEVALGHDVDVGLVVQVDAQQVLAAGVSLARGDHFPRRKWSIIYHKKKVKRFLP